ncbi:bifunctional DNA primase/polymerase [Streptomyces albus]|uniref:bifunctional DNA primase/polymerase n=1 Tax=Streptomyces albus TaxID=1888 RepID=UPI001FC99F22|nr:bifunctional DNA primase/polymerase [Streptomyces albus]
MSDWQPRPWQHPDGSTRFALFRAPAPDDGSLVPARVTAAGAAWLASAAPAPQRVLALWAARPESPVVLPCGTAFDVISAPGMFGRRLLDRLWSEGPGSGPVAVHRGRLLLFTEPGTARRLPALLAAAEWGAAVPPLLCHGTGDAVTVPPLRLPASAATASGKRRPSAVASAHAGAPGPGPGPAPGPGLVDPGPADRGTRLPGTGLPRAGLPGTGSGAGSARPSLSRWLAAPDVRHPWLPGAETLRWACARAVPGGAAAGRALPVPALTAPTGAC